jgi:putative ATP-dependent endonuclease of OLD family
LNILIDTIRISGFRGIKDLEMSLPRVTVLIGPNNSGKTSLLKALQLALGDYSRFISEEDFHIGTDEKPVNKIIVDVRIVPVDKDGKRAPLFDEKWTIEFGDTIKAEANNNQFVALRTRCEHDPITGKFPVSRCTLEKWPEERTWQTEKVKETKLTRFDGLYYISIEAQRDIHQELRDKSSFVGKVLSRLEYSPTDIGEIESLIKKVNEETVRKSDELQSLKTHLDKLNQSFQGSGSAEITPFPKKIRDLAKHFTINFGESSDNSFSMEYHGMGTRSWASMLTMKAFIDLIVARYDEEVKAFFPILGTEEPEAHLHPNAQKTIYRQLSNSKGQVIMSTHSPYLAAMAEQAELRYLKKESNNIDARSLSLTPGTEDYRRLQREVMHSRGEIIFANALVLCEGETEEQALPILFRKYIGTEAFALGVNFVGIGGSGKRYLPFLTFARDFSIPVFIFSDGEEKTIKNLKKVYDSVFGETEIASCPNITILDNTDFEEYLISSGYKSIIEATIKEIGGANAIDNWILEKDGTKACSIKTDSPPCPSCGQHIYTDIFRDYKSSGGYDLALLEILDDNKTRYAPVIAEKLCELELKYFPPKIIDLFDKIKAGAEK